MRSLGLFIILILVSACKKEPMPESATGNAIFYLSGEIDGENKKIVAGNDNFYMNTSIDKYYGLDLHNGNLSDDLEAIQISFFNFPSTSFSLKNKTYNILQFNNMVEHIYVDSISEDVSGFEWKINGISYNQVNIDSLVRIPGKYEICLTLKFGNNSCQQTVCSDYMIGLGDAYDLDFSYKVMSSNQIELVPILNSPDNVKSIRWKLNQQEISQTSIAQSYLSQGVHQFEMWVTYDNDIEIVKRKNIRHQSQNCFFEGVRIINSNKFDLFDGVMIDYTDRNGKKFTSSSVVQSDEGYFEIMNTENYLPNSLGESVINMQVKFNAVLKDISSGEQIHLSNFAGQFGVAVP